MKKKLSLIFLAFLVLPFVFCGCSDSKISQQEIENFMDDLYTYASLSKEQSLSEEIEKYYEYLTDEQKEEALAYLGVCQAKTLLESKLKSSLKDPSSFEWRSFDSGSIPTKNDDGEWSVNVKATYAGKNSFGAYDTKTINGIIYFKVDITTKQIKLTDTLLL